MLPKSFSKRSIFDHVSMYLSTYNTEILFKLFINNGDSEDLALLKLDLIYRICSIGSDVK